jgi:hypothetical protein
MIVTYRGCFSQFVTCWTSVLVWDAVINYHRLGGLKNKYLFCTALETRCSRSGCQYGQTLVEALFLVYKGLSFHYILHSVERNVISFYFFSMMALIALMRANLHDLITTQDLYPNNIALVVRIAMNKFRGWGYEHSVHIVWIACWIYCKRCELSSRPGVLETE